MWADMTMLQSVEVIGEPQDSPTPHDANGKRAVVRITYTPDAATARFGYRGSVAFGVARNQASDGSWLVRSEWKTLKRAREHFAKTSYP